MRLKDKVIIVTGSSQGVGRAIAEAIVHHRGKVILHGRDRQKLQGVADALGAENAVCVAGDLQDITLPKKLVAMAIDTFGRLDGVVNNAGVSPRETIDNMTAENFDFIFNINVRAPMLLVQEAVKHFRKNDTEYPGTVINIGSITGLGGLPKICTYSVSKGALLTFTKNAAISLASDRIRVNQLNLGWTHSEGEHQAQLAEGQPEDWCDHLPPVPCPWGRIWRPEEVANHVTHLLSDAAGPMTGTSYELEQYPLGGHNFG